MNSEIGDNSGQLLGRLNDTDGAAGSLKSNLKKEPSLLKRWAKGIWSTRVEEVKYKQVSAKGYRLK